MLFYDHLENMQSEIRKGNYLEILDTYHELCVTLAGEEQALRIQEVDLNDFIVKIREGFIVALDISNDNKGKAIYCEYDMDNGWESNFFICEEYYPIEMKNDDWACEWKFDIRGPSIEEFYNIYKEYDFDMTNYAIATNLYLIARTVVSYANAIQYIRCDIPICIAYHEQDPIIRIKEKEEV